MQRVEARLCDELAHEHAVVHAAIAADDEPEPAAEVVEKSDPASPDAPATPEPAPMRCRTRRTLRPQPCTLPSYEQARALDSMLLLRKPPPTEPPTPRAQGP
jgi:hypothetical protein